MGCQQYNELICAVVDGEATVEEREALFSHMEECDECRALFDRFRAVSNEMHDMEVDPPEFLASGILYKVGLDSEQKRRPFAFGRFTALAAAVVLVLFIGKSVLPQLKGANSSAAGEPANYRSVSQEQEDSTEYPGKESGSNFVMPDASGSVENKDVYAETALCTTDSPSAEQDAIAAQLAYDARAELEAWANDEYSYYCSCILVDVMPAELAESAELIQYEDDKRTYRADRSLFFSFEQKYQIMDSYFDDMTSEYAIIVIYVSEGGPLDG